MVLRAGLIGYGKRGEVLARIIREYVPEIDIVGVVDPDIERIAAAHNVGFRGWTVSKHFFVADRPDVAIIATNPPQHCELVVMAAEHGCHIFCEKPLALSPDEADRMVAVVEKAGVVSVVDFEMPFADSVQLLRTYLAAEQFGALYRLEMTGKGRPPAYDLEEVMVHYLHLMLWLTGSKPVDVFGRIILNGKNATMGDVAAMSDIYPQSRKWGIGIRADSIEASYRLANGVVAQLFLHEFVEMDHDYMTLSCYGTRGRLTFFQSGTGELYVAEGPLEKSDTALAWERAPRLWASDSDWSIPTARLLREFVSAIQSGRASTASIADASLVLDMTLGVYASHLAGKPVALPLVDRRHPLVAR